MKFASAVITFMLFAMMLPTLALAADNATSEQNLTPVSVSQNATISMPTPSNDSLMKIGPFCNATVYASGGAKAPIQGDSIAIDITEAEWMEYRDVYVFYRLPGDFASVSFDYDLQTGSKSNVLLIDFADSLPRTGIMKGGVPDTAVLGMGTWTNMRSELKGMNGTGGLTAFQQGAHHLAVSPENGVVYLKIDGNTTAYNFFTPKKYLVIHLMVGDENSYLRGTLSNLRYEGPPLDDNVNGGHNSSGVIAPNMTSNGKDNGSSGGQVNVPGGSTATPAAENGTSKPLSGLNIWLALIAGAGFFIAWAIVYVKYLK
jgi:hypothetical protein